MKEMKSKKLLIGQCLAIASALIIGGYIIVKTQNNSQAKVTQNTIDNKLSGNTETDVDISEPVTTFVASTKSEMVDRELVIGKVPEVASYFIQTDKKAKLNIRSLSGKQLKGYLDIGDLSVGSEIYIASSKAAPDFLPKEKLILVKVSGGKRQTFDTTFMEDESWSKLKKEVLFSFSQNVVTDEPDVYIHSSKGLIPPNLKLNESSNKQSKGNRRVFINSSKKLELPNQDSPK